MAKPGDKVKLVCKDEDIEGILMPSEAADSVIVKLDSGYNIGVEKKKIKEIKVLEALKEKREKTVKVKQNPKLPTIAILHTGGTIASKVDYRTGGVTSRFSPEEIVGMFPELAGIANIDSELIANMWSDDLRFKHFELIAKTVEKHVKKSVDGIIISMGTDNLAVASAAMAFVIEETPIPIIFVGAQRSSDRGSSDAAMNLICAVEFIAKSDFAGVALCMHDGSADEVSAILPASKTRKLHSSRRDAFKAVNYTPIAKVNYKTKKVELINNLDYKKDKKRSIVLKPKFEEKVGLLKIHINMFPEQFEFFKGYKGLVIEGTGLGQTPGHAPNEICNIHKKIFPAIKKVIDSGCVIVMTTTTIFGRVNMNVYDKARDLVDLGIIPGEDMLSETAFVKLAWLLGNHKKEEVKKLMTQNLRGEITERSEYEEEFLD
ncbi:Glu-tRNA(Gln) amidotransferase subunit GatD [candidate division KSB1 bacterium]